MRYKNTKTGAIVDSPFLINGDNWELVQKEQGVELTGETDVEEVTEEEIEEEVDLTELTNAQLEELAKEQGVELTGADKKNKDTRIAAIVKALG